MPQLHEHDVHLGFGLWHGIRVHLELELHCNWRVDGRAGVLVYACGWVHIWMLRFRGKLRYKAHSQKRVFGMIAGEAQRDALLF